MADRSTRGDGPPAHIDDYTSAEELADELYPGNPWGTWNVRRRAANAEVTAVILCIDGRQGRFAFYTPSDAERVREAVAEAQQPGRLKRRRD